MFERDIDNDSVSEVESADKNTGKKRKITGRMSDVMKKVRLQSHETGYDCQCKRLKCFENVIFEDRKILLNNLNTMNSNDEQNSYLASMVNVVPIQRRRSRLPDNLAKYKDVTFSYTVTVLRESEGVSKAVEIPVCFKAFLSIFGITKGKLEFIQKSLKRTGLAPKDKRGKTSGSHKSLNIEIQNAIVNHIKSFKSLSTPSHYGRNHSSKIYFPEDLNVRKMYSMFKCHNDYKNFNVSYDSYRKIFNEKFNISFKYPRVDSCSTCDEFQATLTILKSQNKEDEIKKFSIDHNLHVVKAKVFYSRKKKCAKLARKDKMFLSIAMDYQKNVSLPNISTNDIYYKRQLSMYSFNIHSLHDNDAVFYSYPEVNGKKGSNEVASFLFHYVINYVDRTVKDLHIFCDSAGGQNKNFTIIRFLHYVVYEIKLFDSITITFPVRGHSYLECDRDMSIINLKTKMETPDDFYELIKQSRCRPAPYKVVPVESDDIKGWSNFIGRFYVKQCPFKTQPIKEIQFRQDSRLVKYRYTYHGSWETAAIRLPDNKILRNPLVGCGDFELPEPAYEGNKSSFISIFFLAANVNKICSVPT